MKEGARLVRRPQWIGKIMVWCGGCFYKARVLGDPRRDCLGVRWGLLRRYMIVFEWPRSQSIVACRRSLPAVMGRPAGALESTRQWQLRLKLSVESFHHLLW